MDAYGIPLHRMSRDPRVQPRLDEYPSDELGAELEALKESGMFANSPVADDALSSLRGLEGTLASIQAANAAARAGKNDVVPPVRGGDAPMPNLVRYEDYRPEADESTLAARGQTAAENLVRNSDSGLTMGMRGEVIGQGGTPVDQNKAAYAAAGREAELMRRRGILQGNRMLERGFRPMPNMQGVDAMLAMMPPQYAAQIMVAREAARARAAESAAELASRAAIADKEIAGRATLADKEAASRKDVAQINNPAMTPERYMMGRAMNADVPQDPSVYEREARKFFPKEMGPGPSGFPALPPVDNPDKAIDHLFNEASAAGALDPQAFWRRAAELGISPEMLQRYASMHQPSAFASGANPLTRPSEEFLLQGRVAEHDKRRKRKAILDAALKARPK